MTAWHAQSVDDAASQLQSDLARGRGSTEASKRLALHGPNTLAEARQRSMLALVAHQFRSLIVALLVAAALVALVLGERS